MKLPVTKECDGNLQNKACIEFKQSKNSWYQLRMNVLLNCLLELQSSF